MKIKPENEISSHITLTSFPIQNCMGKIAVQLKSHGESEIVSK